MRQFLDRYPKYNYDFLENGLHQEVPDIFRQVRLADNESNKIIQYEYVDFREERPDQLSYRLYGTVDYYWTFFVINEKLHHGMYSWAKNYSEFESYINEKYKYETIRLYRPADYDIDYNSINNGFKIGAIMFGTKSGAVAKVTCRDVDMNTLQFEYLNDKVFIENQFQKIWEEIWVYKWDDWYAINPNDDITQYVDLFYTLNLEEIDIIKDNYDLREGKNALHHWSDIEKGYDYHNYENIDYVLKPDANISFKTNLEYEIDLNEERKRIIVINRQFIEDFAYEYMKKIRS